LKISRLKDKGFFLPRKLQKGDFILQRGRKRKRLKGEVKRSKGGRLKGGKDESTTFLLNEEEREGEVKFTEGGSRKRSELRE